MLYASGADGAHTEMSFPAFFWPTNPDPAPNSAGRLGRVLHWATLLIGSPLVSLGFLAASSHDAGMATALYLWIAGASIIMIGRGLRYILGGE